MRSEQLEITAQTINDEMQIALLVNVMSPSDLFPAQSLQISFDRFVFPEKDKLESECKHCLFESYGLFGSERIVINKS